MLQHLVGPPFYDIQYSMESSRDIRKSRGRPATGRGEGILVRLQPNDLAIVDDWRVRWEARTGKPISRPEVLREMIRVVIRLGGMTD